MISQKLPTVLKLVADNLTEHDIPYALIGAFAMSLYGIPKFTADIDLLTEGRFRPLISFMMERLGYTCFQKTKSFAQFDSELGVLGKIDFMFVSTADGQDILQRRVLVKDELLGDHPVIQPTDVIILKLMAIANNPEWISKDERDILDVLKVYAEGLIHEAFGKLDKRRIFFLRIDSGRGRGLIRSLKKSPVIQARRGSLSYEKKSANRKGRETDDP